ncbi:MAG TPA: YdbH domain-containing protein [Candidatus Cybelea sp.]|nr:YdbH domain-containing protein [Candidatus Cybelea sp.]
MADPSAKTRRRRRRWPVFVILVPVLLVVIGLTARERIAAWAATEVLALRYGVPGRVRIDHIDSGQATIASLSLGSSGQVSAADISLQFNATAMRLDHVEIGRVELHAQYNGHALTLGELDPMLREWMAPHPGPSGPPPSIILHKIVLTIDTPLGQLAGDGMATIDQGVIYSQFALTEPDQRAAIHLDLNAALSNRSPQPQGNVAGEIKAESALWEIFGLPRPTAGGLQFTAQLKQPPGDGTNSGIRLATGALKLAADWSFSAKGLAFPGQPAPADLDGNGRAILAERRLEIPNLDLKAAGGWSPDVALHVQGSALASLEPGKSSAQATLDLSGQMKAVTVGALQARAPALDVGLQLQYGDGMLQIRPSRDGSFKFASAAIGGGVKINKPVTISIKKTDASLITLRSDPPGAGPLDGALTLGPASAEVTVPFAPAPIQLSIPGGALTFSLGSDGTTAYALDVKNAALALSQSDAAAKNLTLGLKGSNGKLDLAVSSPAVTGPSHFGPAALDGKATFDGGKLTANAKLALAAAKASLSAKGGYDIASGKGRFDVEMPPVTFVPGGLQPRDLLASLARRTEDIAGTVALKGPVLVDKGDVTSQLQVTLQGLTGKVGPIALRNLNTAVEIDRPWPLTTAADQVMSVELADVGLPLTGGLVRFKIDDGATLTLAESHFEMMSGRVTLDPVTLKLNAPAQQIHLAVDKISVQRLFQLFAVAGLDGDGILTGGIPVTIFPAGLAIDHAKLAAEGPGHLSYNQAQAPAALQGAGDSVKMAMSALSDFHYDRLEIDLDRAATGDTELGLHIAGRNPSFYNGYPVEFNLKVTGRLDEALRKGLAGYEVPDMIRERLKSLNQ